jgi:hypothetical protein
MVPDLGHAIVRLVTTSELPKNPPNSIGSIVK